MPSQQLVEALKSLQERSLIEQRNTFFFLPPMVRKYVIEQLTEKKISSNIKFGDQTTDETADVNLYGS